MQDNNARDTMSFEVDGSGRLRVIEIFSNFPHFEALRPSRRALADRHLCPWPELPILKFHIPSCVITD